MGSLSLTHWLILLATIVLIFGTKKLRSAGRDLGEAVKGFKDGVAGEPPPEPIAIQTQRAHIDATQ